MTKQNSKSNQKLIARPKKNRLNRVKKTITARTSESQDHGVAQLERVVGHKKNGLHLRNLHRDGYDFEKLTQASPELTPYVRPNPYGNLSIDFANPQAVKALNSALLKHYYQIAIWNIPEGFLCPPIPGRVDYLHYIADLLAGVDAVKNKEDLSCTELDALSVVIPSFKPKKMKINALDIGTGANGIYSLLGIQAYGWRFVASDVDPLSLSNVNAIVEANTCLQGKLETRLQKDHQQIFNGIISVKDRFDVTLCNPPFHSSLAEASTSSQRKITNLTANRAAKGHKSASEVTVSSELNFGGQKAELWCDGGEKQFLNHMIYESKEFASQCLWFTSLVSKKENIKPCYAALEKVGAVIIKTIDMAQGNKLTRVLAWSFLTAEQHKLWAKYRG